MPASTLKTEEDEELADALMPIHDELDPSSHSAETPCAVPARHVVGSLLDVCVFYNVLCALSVTYAGFVVIVPNSELGPPTSDSQAGS